MRRSRTVNKYDLVKLAVWLLTEGFQVRVLAEEPNISLTASHFHAFAPHLR